MLHQMAARRAAKLYPKIIAIGAIISVILCFIGTSLLAKANDAVMAHRDQVRLELAVQADQQSAERESATQQLRAIEQKDLQLQLENTQLKENRKAEILQRLGELELESKLANGTATLSEKIEAQQKQQALHDALMETQGGTGFGGVDKIYHIVNQ